MVYIALILALKQLIEIRKTEEREKLQEFGYVQCAVHRHMAVWCIEDIDCMNTVVQEMYRHGKDQKILATFTRKVKLAVRKTKYG